MELGDRGVGPGGELGPRLEPVAPPARRDLVGLPGSAREDAGLK
jgi:hypothetical protein